MEELKERLFEMFSKSPPHGSIPEGAGLLLDGSGLDPHMQERFLSIIIQEAGKLEIIAKKISRWADAKIMEKRKPVPL